MVCPIDPGSSNDFIVACLNYAATEHAALIQGWYTLGAGALAVVGGAFAYFGAVRQSQLAERNDRARRMAYIQRMAAIIEPLLLESVVLHGEAQEQHEHYLGGIKAAKLAAYDLVFPRELDMQWWEEHALLGSAAVPIIVELRDQVAELRRFVREMNGKPWDEISESPTLGKGTEGEDGVIYYDKDIAVIQNLKICEEVSTTLRALSDAIKDAGEELGLKKQPKAKLR